MPTPPSKRNYQAEYAAESPARKAARAERNRARRAYENAHGGKKLPTNIQVDHTRAVSEGGTNATKNLRAIPKKENESFVRAGPGGKQIGKAAGHGKKK